MNDITNPRHADQKQYTEALQRHRHGLGQRPIPPKWHPDYRLALPELIAAGICDQNGNALPGGTAVAVGAPAQPPQQPAQQLSTQPAGSPAGYFPPGAAPHQRPQQQQQYATQQRGVPHQVVTNQPQSPNVRSVSNQPMANPGLGHFQPQVVTPPMMAPSSGYAQGGFISNHQQPSQAGQPAPVPNHHEFMSPTPVPPAMRAVPPSPVMPSSQVPSPRMATPESIYGQQPQPVAVGQQQAQPQQAQLQTAGINPQIDDGRLRGAIIGPRMLMTGNERFVCDLIAHTDATQVRWSAIAVMQPEMFIRQIEIERSGAELMGTLQGAQMAAAQSDVVVLWGMPMLTAELGDTPAIHVQDTRTDQPAIDIQRVQPHRPRAEVREELGLGHWAKPPGDRTQGWQAPTVRQDKKAIAFIGRLHNHRNPYALVQAIAQLPEQYVAVFVGEGSHAVELRMYCESILGAPEKGRFRFLGARPDIGDLLAGVDALVVPSLTATHGYAILEAWAAGVPVLSTPMGIAAEHKDAVVTLPRALDEVGLHLRNEALEVPELAERVGTLYAEAIGDVFGENPDGRAAMLKETAARVARGFELASTRYTPAAFGAQWTRRLLEAGRPNG